MKLQYALLEGPANQSYLILAPVLVVHGEGRPAEEVLPHLEVDVAAELRPILADVEGLFGEDGLGGHRVHPAQVRPLAELEDAGGRLA